MRKALVTTTALAFAGAMAAGSASAADMLSVGVGGYMQQWVGMTDVTDSADSAVEGGVAQHSDSEIFFRGRLEADNGLTFSVKFELEGNDPGIDESQLTVRGEFGEIVLGAEDGASVLTHHGVRDAGFGMLCGDMGRWTGGNVNECGPIGLGTAGHGFGDRNNISYFSPRVNGIQFGATYVPNVAQEGRGGAPRGTDNDAWAIGGNYKGDFGGAKVAVSLGHYNMSQTDHGDLEHTNIGLQVGMGAFSFDVAAAMADDGRDTDSSADVDIAAAGMMYTDGPMAVSLSHTMTDADDGTEQAGTMLSASYKLAPGIAWRATLFTVERTRGTMPGSFDFGVPAAQRNMPAANAGTSVEGSGFVTGITVGF